MILNDLTVSELNHAILIQDVIENGTIINVARWFEQQTGQAIPDDVIKKFMYSGLSPIYLISSDFLNKYNLENLPQFTARMALNKKTYADLTDDQLRRLAGLADHAGLLNSNSRVIRGNDQFGNPSIEVWINDRATRKKESSVVYFDVESGDVHRNDSYTAISNLFAFVKKCREFGLSY